MRITAISVACLLVACAATAAFGGPVNLITNGGFEDPAIAPGSFTVLPSVTGWTSTAGIEVQSSNSQGPGLVTPFGNQYVELNVLGPSTLSQTIATVPGQMYNLDFSLSAHPGTGSNSVRVGFTGNPDAIFTATDTGTLDFQSFKQSFLASSATSTLSFSPTGTFANPQLGDELDNVSLAAQAPVTAAVPLPAAFWPGMGTLSIIGSILVISSSRRRGLTCP